MLSAYPVAVADAGGRVIGITIAFASFASVLMAIAVAEPILFS